MHWIHRFIHFLLFFKYFTSLLLTLSSHSLLHLPLSLSPFVLIVSYRSLTFGFNQHTFSAHFSPHILLKSAIIKFILCFFWQIQFLLPNSKVGRTMFFQSKHTQHKNFYILVCFLLISY